MMYAILDETGTAVLKAGSARELWPDTAVPKAGPNQAFLDANNAQRVQDSIAHDPATERIRIVEPYFNPEDGLVYRFAVEALPPNVTPPDLDGFVGTLEDSAQWTAIINSLVTGARPQYGYALAGALVQLSANGDYVGFLRIWRKLILNGDIPEARISQLQDVATNNNLPQQFINRLDPR